MNLRRLAPFIFSLSVVSLAAPRTVPDLSLKDLSGQKQKLSSLRGNIVVLSFWATWCGPCQEELPRLSRLNATYVGKPVRFIAVSIDEAKSRNQISSFLEQRDIHLPVWTGATPDTMEQVGLTNIVPSTLILDQDGRPITRITGEAHMSDISSRLDWLLNHRPGPAPEPVLKRTAFVH